MDIQERLNAAVERHYELMSSVNFLVDSFDINYTDNELFGNPCAVHINWVSSDGTYCEVEVTNLDDNTSNDNEIALCDLPIDVLEDVVYAMENIVEDEEIEEETFEKCQNSYYGW